MTKKKILFSHSEHTDLKRNNKSTHFNYRYDKKLHLYINQLSQKLVLLLVFVCVVVSKSSAHSSFKDPTWIYDTVINRVQFYHFIVDCIGKKVVFLKFNNQNKNNVEVSWKEVFTTQSALDQEGFHGLKKLTLITGETSASDCLESKKRNCLILPDDVSPAYEARIQKFKFKEIIVRSI